MPSIDNKGRLIGDDGNPINIHDYLYTKPYKKRIYDYNSPNKSFVNVYKLLKGLGVKNCNEHLQLFNEKLLGIDPHSPNIPDNIKVMIIQECKINIWYYLREVVRVPSSSGLNYFDLNIASFCAAFLVFRRQNFLYELPRQVGKTYLLTTLLGWMINFGGNNMKLANIHYKLDNAISNINMIRNSMNSTPRWMHFHKKEKGKINKKTGKETVKDSAIKSENSKQLENRINKNRIETFVIGGSKDQASTTGRGTTRDVYFMDEVAHTKNIDIATASLMQSTTTAKINGKRNGTLFGVWQLCTPGNLSSAHGRWVFERLKEYISFGIDDLFLLEMTEYELNEYIAKRSITNFWHVKFSWQQMGYSEEWFFEKNRNEEVETILTEVLLEWNEKSLDSPFNRTTLAALESKSKQMNNIQLIDYDDYNQFTIYPETDESYNSLREFILFNYAQTGVLIGVDVANGTGGDSSSLVFLDPEKARVIATYQNNLIDTDDFSILIIHILKEIFLKHGIKCAIQIERNNSGTSVLARIKKMNSIQKYLMMYPVNERKAQDLNLPVDFELRRNGIISRYDFGLNVTSGNRGMLTNDLLMTIVKKHMNAICVPAIVKELKSLVKKKRLDNVRVEHTDGAHDDLVFAMIHAFYMIYKGADILKSRHKIVIDPSKWILTSGVDIVTGIKANKRISTMYVTDDFGNLRTILVDNKTKRELTEEEAKELDRLEKEYRISDVMSESEQENMKKMKEKEEELFYQKQEKEFQLDYNALFPEELERIKNPSVLSALYDEFNYMR